MSSMKRRSPEVILDEFPLMSLPYHIRLMISDRISTIQSSIEARKASRHLRELIVLRGLMPRRVQKFTILFNESHEDNGQLYCDRPVIGVKTYESHEVLRFWEQNLFYRCGKAIAKKGSSKSANFLEINDSSWSMSLAENLGHFLTIHRVHHLSLINRARLCAIDESLYFGDGLKFEADLNRFYPTIACPRRPINLNRFFDAFERIDTWSLSDLRINEIQFTPFTIPQLELEESVLDTCHYYQWSSREMAANGKQLAHILITGNRSIYHSFENACLSAVESPICQAVGWMESCDFWCRYIMEWHEAFLKRFDRVHQIFPSEDLFKQSLPFDNVLPGLSLMRRSIFRVDLGLENGSGERLLMMSLYSGLRDIHRPNTYRIKPHFLMMLCRLENDID